MKLAGTHLNREFKVAPPLTLDLPIPEQSRTPSVKERSETVTEKRAIWAVHGMGQQIPFETIDSVAEGVMRFVEQANPSRPPIEPRARAVRVGDQVLQRVELDVVGSSGRPYELHIYEAYWAPLTEGKVNLRDVIGFLFDGGSRGVLNSMKSFKRAMFGTVESFKIPKQSAAYIVIALLVVIALAVINAVIVAETAAHKHVVDISLGVRPERWIPIGAVAGVISAVAITFGAVLFVAVDCQANDLSQFQRKIIGLFSWVGFRFTLLVIIFGSAFLSCITWKRNFAGWLSYELASNLSEFATLATLAAMATVLVALITRAWLRSNGDPLEGSSILTVLFCLAFVLHLSSILGPLLIGLTGYSVPSGTGPLESILKSPFWVWPFLIVISAVVRTFLIEYVGDVAAYISPNKLDRFQKLRTEIKTTVRTSALAVYQASTSGGFEYQHIAIVGHSLGSVIAYDTLNSLMNDDALSKNPLRVCSRTTVFETFGSPLDKIAFMFTIQGKDTFQVREQLAEVVQPLIQNYGAFRQLAWINVHTKNDIISGPLTFYDLPKGLPPGAKTVKEVIDNDAVVPLVAHVAYWKNPTIWRELCDQIIP